ncbi:hypothetical protein CVT26_007310 [Gymnopilus dilepis]|uniref:Succinate dehydrogenase assembly factor 3 n=1 Tax=Gymnopilus dilepis TaxID=231916 RepID=A0A409W1D9_9AGAR|nr:hypothetical protein CVT26_007310 [Gymnopilus dilepis]
MHPTLSRLAESVSKVPLNLTEASAMLYPPIPLYRRLLRAHRNLPREMRSLGDDYVKSEFRRHKEVTNPVYIMGFLSQWKTYLDQMPRDPNTPFTGKRLDPTVFEKAGLFQQLRMSVDEMMLIIFPQMSDEQLGQLYELMHAAKDVWKPVQPGDGEEQKS